MEEASWGQSADGFQPPHSGGVPSHCHADPADIPAVGDVLPAHSYSTRYGGSGGDKIELPIAFSAAGRSSSMLTLLLFGC